VIPPVGFFHLRTTTEEVSPQKSGGLILKEGVLHFGLNDSPEQRTGRGVLLEFFLWAGWYWPVLRPEISTPGTNIADSGGVEKETIGPELVCSEDSAG